MYLYKTPHYTQLYPTLFFWLELKVEGYTLHNLPAMAKPSNQNTGLMNFTLRNLGVWTLRRGCCLSEASFSPFSSTLTDFSKIRAALTFCFFSVKGKEKDKKYHKNPIATQCVCPPHTHTLSLYSNQKTIINHLKNKQLCQ